QRLENSTFYKIIIEVFLFRIYISITARQFITYHMSIYNYGRKMIMLNRTLIGVIIIVIGGGFLLQQADNFPFTSFLGNLWPAIFVLVVIIQLLYRTQTSLFTGPLFLIIGVLLLVNQWADIHLFSYLWPLIIIYVGFIFIFFRAKHDDSIDD